MSTSADCEFHFQKVGQGLFYTGKIDTFHFVYDCGSRQKKSLFESIDSYKNKLNGGEIDLLVISHFHCDHVSGLDHLFQNFEVTDVIIPYFAPIERLILALRRGDIPKWYSRWYYNFLADPVSYFLDKEVRRIIIVGRGWRKGQKRDSGKDFKKNTKESSEKIRKEFEIPPLGEEMPAEKMPENQDLREIIMSNDPSWQKPMKENRLFVKDHNGVVSLSSWLFRFFNYKPEERNLAEFRSCVTGMGVSAVDPISVKNAITDESKRETLKDCYGILFKDLNNTSLVLYHGPIGKNRSDFTVDGEHMTLLPGGMGQSRLLSDSALGHIAVENRMGQLLTGDIDLNHDYVQINAHYSGLLQKTSACQVPHHGSKRTWNSKIMDDLENCSHWIVSSGTSDQLGHPHFDVCHDISSRCRGLYLCNQKAELTLNGSVQWY